MHPKTLCNVRPTSKLEHREGIKIPGAEPIFVICKQYNTRYFSILYQPGFLACLYSRESPSEIVLQLLVIAVREVKYLFVVGYTSVARWKLVPQTAFLNKNTWSIDRQPLAFWSRHNDSQMPLLFAGKRCISLASIQNSSMQEHLCMVYKVCLSKHILHSLHPFIPVPHTQRKLLHETMGLF